MNTAPRRRIAWVALAAVAAVVLAWEGWGRYAEWTRAGRLFATGWIEATQEEVGPRIPGRVIRLRADEGDQVRAGQVLAEMEPQESQAQVDQARAAVVFAEARVTQAEQAVTTQQQVTDAQVAQARAQVSSAEMRVPQAETVLAIQERTTPQATAAAEAQVSAAEAQVAAAASALAKAGDDLRRAKDLFAQGAVARGDLDAAQTAYDAAIAQQRSAEAGVRQARAGLASAQANQMQVVIAQRLVQIARSDLAQAQAGLNNALSGYTLIAQRRQDLAAVRAALAQARANLRYLEVVAAHNTITSPLDGVVLTKNIQAGEVVAAGTSIFTVIDPKDIWLRVYIPEDQIGRVRLDQRVRVTVDTFPNRIFGGRVIEISSKAEFTPVNVQSKEDRVKLVFGVKIRLDNPAGSLKAGMPADAEILVTSPEDQVAR